MSKWQSNVFIRDYAKNEDNVTEVLLKLFYHVPELLMKFLSEVLGVGLFGGSFDVGDSQLNREVNCMGTPVMMAIADTAIDPNFDMELINKVKDKGNPDGYLYSLASDKVSVNDVVILETKVGNYKLTDSQLAKHIKSCLSEENRKKVVVKKTTWSTLLDFLETEKELLIEKYSRDHKTCFLLEEFLSFCNNKRLGGRGLPFTEEEIFAQGKEYQELSRQIHERLLKVLYKKHVFRDNIEYTNSLDKKNPPKLVALVPKDRLVFASPSDDDAMIIERKIFEMFKEDQKKYNNKTKERLVLIKQITPDHLDWIEEIARLVKEQHAAVHK